MIQSEVVGPGRLRIAGTVDVTCVAELRSAIDSFLDRTFADQPADRELLLDLGEFEPRDATGLGVLLGAHRRARRVGFQLVISAASAQLMLLLSRTRFYRLLDFADTVRLPEETAAPARIALPSESALAVPPRPRPAAPPDVPAGT